MKHQAIIFDLDGTLLNTLDDIAASVNQALMKLSLPTLPVESYRLKVGEGSRTMVSRCMNTAEQHLVDDVQMLHKDYYRRHCCDLSHPYPGIPQLLQYLKKTGIRCAVLSNKDHIFTTKMVRHFFKDGVFDIVQGSLDELPFKPDPTGALRIARKWNIDVDQIVFIGDTSIDMNTACQAGMYPVGALWGFRDQKELVQSGAAVVIETPGDFPDVLARA